MRVGIVQTSNLENKVEEALHNANDRGDNITFLIQEHSMPKLVELLTKNDSVTSMDFDGRVIFLVKHLRVTIETIDYYV